MHQAHSDFSQQPPQEFLANPSMSRGLPFFHALTGCDTTSSFKGKAKKSAWQTWKSFQAATPIFEELSQSHYPILHPWGR